jgi:hypothetical protein
MRVNLGAGLVESFDLVDMLWLPYTIPKTWEWAEDSTWPFFIFPFFFGLFGLFGLFGGGRRDPFERLLYAIAVVGMLANAATFLCMLVRASSLVDVPDWSTTAIIHIAMPILFAGLVYARLACCGRFGGWTRWCILLLYSSLGLWAAWWIPLGMAVAIGLWAVYRNLRVDNDTTVRRFRRVDNETKYSRAEARALEPVGAVWRTRCPDSSDRSAGP